MCVMSAMDWKQRMRARPFPASASDKHAPPPSHRGVRFGRKKKHVETRKLNFGTDLRALVARESSLHCLHPPVDSLAQTPSREIGGGWSSAPRGHTAASLRPHDDELTSMRSMRCKSEGCAENPTKPPHFEFLVASLRKSNAEMAAEKERVRPSETPPRLPLMSCAIDLLKCRTNSSILSHECSSRD